jgi:hypothetical protein
LKGCWVGAHFELVVLVDERLHLQARRYCRLHGRCAGLRAPFRRRRLLTLPRCVLPQVCVNPTQVCVNPTLGCVLTFCTSGDTSCSAPTPPRVRSTSRRGGLHAAEGAGEGGGAPAVSCMRPRGQAREGVLQPSAACGRGGGRGRGCSSRQRPAQPAQPTGSSRREERESRGSIGLVARASAALRRTVYILSPLRVWSGRQLGKSRGGGAEAILSGTCRVVGLARSNFEVSGPPHQMLQQMDRVCAGPSALSAFTDSGLCGHTAHPS